jgi:hypothetical protein
MAQNRLTLVHCVVGESTVKPAASTLGSHPRTAAANVLALQWSGKPGDG